MANWQLTADLTDATQKAPAGIINAEAYTSLVNRGFVSVAKEKFAQVREMEALVNMEKVKFSTGTGATYAGIGGQVPMNRDDEDPIYASAATGFPWSYTTQQFRLFLKITRAAIEDDTGIGFTKERIPEMLEAHIETVETRIADLFNRADGVGATGAPALAPDGGYLLDESRPNPDADAGTWGNVEATGAITGDMLFDAALNARKGVAPNGRLFAQTIKRIAIPAEYENAMFTLLSTNKLVGTNYNDASWAAAKFNMDQVSVLSRLTSPFIFYFLSDPKSMDNGIRLAKYQDVSSNVAWGSGSETDVLFGRIRSRWGLYLRDVRKTLRGGRLSAL